jgi:beta-sarcoglycan
MGSKSNRCISLTLNDPTSLFFWALLTILFVLVIGNFILTLSIISFFKIGLGMESIEIVPEARMIKFFGSADFNKVYKKDGLIESFKDVPMSIEGEL